MQNGLGYRTVKRILKENVNGQVTEESVTYVKEFFETQIKSSQISCKNNS